jgi:hypothetical protein
MSTFEFVRFLFVFHLRRGDGEKKEAKSAVDKQKQSRVTFSRSAPKGVHIKHGLTLQIAKFRRKFDAVSKFVTTKIPMSDRLPPTTRQFANYSAFEKHVLTVRAGN